MHPCAILPSGVHLLVPFAHLLHDHRYAAQGQSPFGEIAALHPPSPSLFFFLPLWEARGSARVMNVKLVPFAQPQALIFTFILADQSSLLASLAVM
jgi:hypothetical protein